MIAIYVPQDHFYLVDVEEPHEYESHEYKVVPQPCLQSIEGQSHIESYPENHQRQ